MSCFHPNYLRYGCWYGFEEVPEDCPVCEACGDYIKPGEDILRDSKERIYHASCIETEKQYGYIGQE